MQNLESTVLAQYANSPCINALQGAINQWLDPSQVINSYYANVFNLDTALGFGLDIWGRIVGVSRVLQVQNTAFFGFQEATNYVGFNQAVFFAGGAITSNYSLSDSAFRALIYAKAMSNISNGSITSINNLLLNLFPGAGDCWVADGNNMTITYHFAFAPTPVQLAIIEQTGIVPRPSGVSATVVHA